VFELDAGAEEVDGEQVEADGDALAVLAGELAEPGVGHEPELALLGAVDRGFGGGEVAGGASLDFENDEGGTVPGEEVDITAEFGGGPALGDDGETEAAEVEERSLLTAEAGDEVGRKARGRGAALEGFEGALLKVEGEGCEGHPCKTNAVRPGLRAFSQITSS